MREILQQKLEDLIKPNMHSCICTVSTNPVFRGSRYSYSPLYKCTDGTGEPEVRGFRNGHYAGVLLMPKMETKKAYFTILEGNLDAAIKDMEIIMRLINSNALFPERRAAEIVFCNEIKRHYD